VLHSLGCRMLWGGVRKWARRRLRYKCFRNKIWWL